MRFPLFRKYSNNKSYFKVLDDQSFEEIQIIGSKILLFNFAAKIMPDRFLVRDMIELKDGRWLEIDESEYLEIRQKVDSKK